MGARLGNARPKQSRRTFSRTGKANVTATWTEKGGDIDAAGASVRLKTERELAGNPVWVGDCETSCR